MKKIYQNNFFSYFILTQKKPTEMVGFALCGEVWAECRTGCLWVLAGYSVPL